jgi:hypothetical protein
VCFFLFDRPSLASTVRADVDVVVLVCWHGILAAFRHNVDPPTEMVDGLET